VIVHVLTGPGQRLRLPVPASPPHFGACLDSKGHPIYTLARSDILETAGEPVMDPSAGEDTLCAGGGRRKHGHKPRSGRAKDILRRIFLSRIFLMRRGHCSLHRSGLLSCPLSDQAASHQVRHPEPAPSAHTRAVRTNPYTFTLSIRNLDLKEQDDATPILGFKELFTNFELFSSLKNWAFTFALIRLDEPRVNVLMRKDGKLNLEELAAAAAGEATEKAQRGIPPDPHDLAAVS